MTLIDCISAIPSKMQDFLHSFDLPKKELLGFDEIVFIASGSSYNAAFLSSFFIREKLEIRTCCLWPNLFLQNPYIFSKKTLYVFISQSGKSKAVYEALKKLKEQGLVSVAITDDAGSKIAKTASFHVDLKIGGEPFVFRTIGYSQSVLACLMLALSMKGKELEFLDDLEVARTNLACLQKASSSWIEQGFIKAQNSRAVLFAAANSLYAVANEASIKFMEMLPVVSSSYEIEEFIHGPQNAFRDDLSFFILHKKGFDNGKSLQVARFLKSKFKEVALVGDEVLDNQDLKLEIKSKDFYFLEYVCASQVLAFHYARLKGRDLGQRINKDIDLFFNKSL